MFNLSLTACSFHLRKTNSRGNTKIFNLNMPLTLQKEDGTECYFQDLSEIFVATVYKGNIIKNLIMDCQSYTKYRPNETTGGIFVSWRRKEELPTGA